MAYFILIFSCREILAHSQKRPPLDTSSNIVGGVCLVGSDPMQNLTDALLWAVVRSCWPTDSPNLHAFSLDLIINFSVAANACSKSFLFTHDESLRTKWRSGARMCESYLRIQGDATLVSELWKPLFQAYVDGFQNPSSHLITYMGDLLWHMKCIDTWHITLETCIWRISQLSDFPEFVWRYAKLYKEVLNSSKQFPK